MIKVSYEDIVSKIKEKSNISDAEIEERVNKKLKHLSGLISREGAAHIVANEMGVKIFEPFSGKLQIKNILSGMRDVETLGKVLEVYGMKEFNTGGRSGKIGSITIGDETDSIRVVMWGVQADNIKNIAKGNVIKILGGYVRENQGRREIHINDRSKILINPKGEDVEASAAQKSKRKSIKDLGEGDNDIELLGTIVQVFEPRFFDVCSQCGKKVKATEEGFVCSTHNVTQAANAYVVNAVLDDGTDTLRTVFFRSNAEKLLNVGQSEFARFKEHPEEFNKVKDGIPGTIVRLVGRANKNAMFDRLEFIVNSTDINPSPEEELKRIGA
ncbi:hypothetical protein HYX09_02545 [Candidatus Woesearchaeota archaeon]|nr:hypothetical protein [Candidatus Woesearchaeota archaeon]